MVVLRNNKMIHMHRLCKCIVLDSMSIDEVWQRIKGIPPPVSVKVTIVSIWFIYHYLLIAMICPHKETSERIELESCT